MKSIADIEITDSDGADDLAPWDLEVKLSSGEVMTLPPRVARMRRSILEARETERIAFCARNQLDPATFRGCHGCGGTGWAWANNLPCWCAQGKSALAQVQRREQEETDRLRELVTNETRKTP